MKVICPHCGKEVLVNGLGRKPLNLPVKNIRDKFKACGSITETAKEFGCSRGHIYYILKPFPRDKEHDRTIQDDEGIPSGH
jgi:DNA invertase Pin-like site-specific DNA recombinase